MMNNNIRPDLRKYYSYDNRTGDLTIQKTRIYDSGVYTCGAKFNNDKHFVYLTVVTGNIFLSISVN